MSVSLLLLSLALTAPTTEADRLDLLDGNREQPREVSLPGVRLPPASRVLQLDEVLDIARRNNPHLQISELQAQRASFLYRKAWTQILPNIGFAFGGTLHDRRVWLPLEEPGRDDDIKWQGKLEWTMSAGFRWNILDGPRSVGVQIADSLGDLQAAKHELVAAQLDASVTRAFYALLAVQRQLDVHRNDVDFLANHLDSATRRAGPSASGSPLDVLRARTALLAARYAAEQSSHARRLAALALSVLMGERHEDNPEADLWAREVPQRQRIAPTLDHAQARALAEGQRLDLETHRLEHTVAGRRKFRTWTRYLPRLVASGDYTWTDTPGIYGEPTRWQAGLFFEWDLLSGGTHYWDLQLEERDLRISEVVVTQTLVDIDWEVAAALIDQAAARSHHRTSVEWEQLASQTAAAVHAAYDAGRASAVEVLEAARARTAASTAHNMSLLSRDLAEYATTQVTLTPQGLQ